MPGPNLFQIRRTSVADREANTVTLPNVGEMGVNLTDGRMWVANSTSVFEIGANTKNCRVSNTLLIGNASINTTANSTYIETDTAQLDTAVYVGANVDLTTVALLVGNTTVNLIANSTIIKLANSTVNTSISVPTSGQYSATNYFLHANGSWVQVTGGSGSVRVYQSYTATGGQTTYTVSGGYTIGQIEVFENGVHLANTEYTQDGSTVVLGTGSLVGAIVEVSGWINMGSFSPVASGSNTQIQFNDSSAFGGSSGFTFNKDANNVLIANTLSVGTSTVNAVTNSLAFILANSTVTYSLIKPTAAQVSSADYYPASDGSWKQVTGGAGTPGGSNTYIQYNDSGAFNGSAAFTFDETTNVITIANTLAVGANVTVSTSNIKIGNDSINGTANSIILSLSNSTGTSNLTPTSLAIGASFIANSTGVFPASNTVGQSFGNTISRWDIDANSVMVSVGVSPDSNTVGTALGSTTQRWNLTANSSTLSGGLTAGGTTVVNSTMVSVTAGSLLSANIQINAQTGTTYTLAATDSGKVVTMNNAGAMTVTVPAGLPIGFRTQVLRLGAGTCTLSNTGQTGCSIFSRTAAFAVTAQYGSASVFQTATANTYVIDGNI